MTVLAVAWLSQAEAASLSDFTIYAKNNVFIGVGSTVGTSSQTALVGAGTGTVATGDASLNGTAGIYGDLRAGDDVTLGNNSFVTGTITNPDGFTVGSGVTYGSRVVAMPDLSVVFPTATSFSAGVTNQAVGNGQSLTLAAGSWNDITLGGAATLNLTAGNYYLRSLTAGNGLTINIALGGGNVNLYILEDFNVGGIQAMNLSGGTWANVFAEAQGSGITGSALNNVFRIGGGNGTNWKGTVVTTNGGIHLGGSSGCSTCTIEGRLWSAQNVDLEHGVHVVPPAVVPVPAAIWLFGGAIAALAAVRRKAIAAS